MTEYVSLEKKDLLAAYSEATGEERELLEMLYPDVLPPEEVEERDVTDEIRFEKVDEFFRIRHGDHTVAVQDNACSVNPSGELTIKFNIPSGSYRFEATSNHNWKIIKEDG